MVAPAKTLGWWCVESRPVCYPAQGLQLRRKRSFCCEVTLCGPKQNARNLSNPAF